MNRYGRRRSRRNLFLGGFYLNLSPSAQYTSTVVSAVLFSGFVFSGFLLFRYTDSADLLNRGKRLMAEGKVAWAVETLETLVKNHQDSYDGHLALGQAYLAMGDRRKAENEFQVASSLKIDNLDDTAADVALSKIAITRKEFQTAETRLLRAWRKKPQDADITAALFDLYEQWGNTLLADLQDEPGAIAQYEKALRYATEYRLENQVKDKLIEVINTHADRLTLEKKDEDALRMLKKSLRYRYLPDTLIEIAEAYEKAGHLEDAITWYRKAFDANPGIISLKLSNMLLEKGRALVKEKQPKAAEPYFQEAKQVLQAAQVPLDVLYPVEARAVHITADVDADTGEFQPEVRATFYNRSSRVLNFLVARATFYAGDTQIAEATEVVATPEKPLEGKDTGSHSHQTVVFKTRQPLNTHDFDGQKLRVKLAIGYNESVASAWRDVAIQETALQGSSPVAQATTGETP